MGDGPSTATPAAWVDAALIVAAMRIAHAACAVCSWASANSATAQVSSFAAHHMPACSSSLMYLQSSRTKLKSM